jgi:hypothetical protein
MTGNCEESSLEATGGVAEVVVTHLMVVDKLVGQQVLEDMVTGRFLSGLVLFVVSCFEQPCVFLFNCYFEHEQAFVCPLLSSL